MFLVSLAPCSVNRVSDSTLATEHPDLLASAVDLTAHLGAARGRLVPLGSLWVPHTEFGDRVRYLSHHLRGALLLVDDDLYAQAFAVLRSALEHHVQDHLLFLGNRFKAVQEGVTDETLAEWQKAIAEGGTASQAFWKSDG